MKILALPGGGAAGYAVATYLQRLQAQFDKPVTTYFDLIVGVSTGGIIAAALAADLSPAEIAQFYDSYLPKIFRKKHFWSGWFKSAKYEPDALREGFEQILPGKWSDLSVPCMTYAVQITPTIQAMHWKSWREEHVDTIADVLLATSSAPTYFRPHTIGDRVYVDGGVLNANPVLHAIAEGLRLGASLEDIQVVSVDPYGNPSGIANGADVRSAIQWVRHLAPVFMFSDEGAASYAAAQLLGDRFTEVALNVETEMDDASRASLDRMVNRAIGKWAEDGENRLVPAILRGRE